MGFSYPCEKILKNLKYSGPTREIMRGLQRYMVHLPIRMVEQMKRNGLLEEIHLGIWVQSLSSLYSREIGLDVFRENLPVEDLIFDNPNQKHAR